MADLEYNPQIRNASFDPDLTALYELEMTGVTFAVPMDRALLIEGMDEDEVAQLRSEVKRTYGLAEQDFGKAVGALVARIAEEQTDVAVKPGKEFFKNG